MDRVVLPPEEAPQRADPGRHALLLVKPRLHFLQRDVGRGLHQAQQVVAMGVQLRALRLALVARPRSPFSRARRTHTMAVDTPTPNRSLRA